MCDLAAPFSFPPGTTVTPLLPVGGFDHQPRLISLCNKLQIQPELPVASASSGVAVHLPSVCVCVCTEYQITSQVGILLLVLIASVDSLSGTMC